jgi:branched-subunit amino acid aminotransferase/4-amino-4-deoxychorismate lyase
MRAAPVIFNGRLTTLDGSGISATNRAFRYGDALYENIRLCNGKVIFLEAHLARSKANMIALGMTIPSQFDPPSLQALILRLVEKGETGGNARIRLTVFRTDGGAYVPEANEVSFLIEAEKMDTAGFVLNKKGLVIDVFEDIRKPINKLSQIKNANSLLYVVAGLAMNSRNLDECLLLNERGNICESINGNVFLVKGGSLHTAPLTEGCVDGTMRTQIFRLAENESISIVQAPISVESVVQADEVFLSSSTRGVQWVAQFRSRRFANRQAEFLTAKLNDLAGQ